MSSGYIYLETHPEHPTQLRLLQYESKPSAEHISDGAQLRYIARFNNLFRGHQQMLGLLGRQLVDADRGLFKVELLDAIAIVETLPLRAERIWIDPALDSNALGQLEQKVERVKRKRKRVDLMWKTVGLLLVALLVLRALTLF